MKHKGRRGSANVEDRRGMSRGQKMVGGGIGTIVLLLIALLMGGDPLQLLSEMQMLQQQAPAQVSAEQDEMAEFVSVVLADTEEVWHKIFRQTGQTYKEPKLILFRDQVQSACGFASAASGPFYCPGDESIYIDLSFCDVLKHRFGAHGDFAVAYVIAHEVGHHVQKLWGIIDQVHTERSRAGRAEANQLTVRLELQADFLAGFWAHYAQKMLDILEEGDLEEALNAAASVGDDAVQMKTQGRIVPDDFTHGTSQQRRAWFKKGFSTGDLSHGDTFGRNVVL